MRRASWSMTDVATVGGVTAVMEQVGAVKLEERVGVLPVEVVVGEGEEEDSWRLVRRLVEKGGE